MAFIKEESEDMRLKKHSESNMKILRTQTKIVFIKEESEDMKMKKHSESNMKILRNKQRCVY